MKMKRIEKSIMINPHQGNIWEMLAAERFPEWQPELRNTKKIEYLTEVKTPEDKFKLGMHIVFDKTCHHELVEIENDRLIKYKIYEKILFWQFEGYITFRMEPKDEKTNVTYIVNFHKPVGLLSLLVFDNYLIRKWTANKMGKSLDNLKHIVEKKE